MASVRRLIAMTRSRYAGYWGVSVSTWTVNFPLASNKTQFSFFELEKFRQLHVWRTSAAEVFFRI